MKQKIRRISAPCIAILLLANMFAWVTPASAGVAVWSAETIPSTVDNILGPDKPGDNLDVRDFSMTSDTSTIYAVPGDSISDNVVYKSVDYGVTWTVINNIDITADFVAVAPDDSDIVAIANSTTAEVYLTTDGGTTWAPLGTPQESGGVMAEDIYDIAISDTREAIHYIAAAGTDTAGDANVWYFNSGAVVPTWKGTNDPLNGFDDSNEVAAVAFSPNFSSDVAMVAISVDIGANVKLQILDISAEKWNSDAGYVNYPCTVVSDNGTTGLTSASLSLAPDYLASDDDRRTLFIGLTVNGTTPSAVATSGIYRFVDTVRRQLRADIQIHSVAFNGSYLIAGSYDSNVVYRCTDPLSVSPTVLTAATTKYPGGDNKVLVAWLTSSFAAGTSGNESAFSISTDNGLTFNDISLIDTVIQNARDVAVSSSGGVVYLVTDDGNDTSLWRRSSSWQRVFSLQGTTNYNYIVRIAPENANYVYLAKQGTTTIYYNSFGGGTQWHTRICNLDIQDLAVESTAVVYALDNAGAVSKTVNTGLSWGTPVSTTLNGGATIVSVSTNIILVGSQNGYVAYSTDGNTTWTIIIQLLEAGAGKVQVIADQYYSSNHIIYAASDTTGGNIKKWQIGTSTAWADIFNGTLNGGIYGLAIDSNILYALEYTAGQSTLWLCIAPTSATAISTSWSSSTTTTTTDIDDNTVRLDAPPQALRASTGKLWAVKTNDTNKLYSFSDTTITLTLIRPASGFTGRVNAFTGIADDIPFSWQRPSVATEYELQIARDEDFYIHVATVTVATENPVVFVLVGPGQPGNAGVNFMPGVTYYWKTRTTKPIYSRYSASKYFSIEPVMAVLPEMLAPSNGEANISRKPAFSWTPVAGAAEYQFVLSANITMDSPIVDVTLTTTGFTMTRELDYGGTYFWRIRSIKPVTSDWSVLANFTVEKQSGEPVPVVTVKQRTPPVVELPEPTPETIITLAPPLKPPAPVAPDYLRTAIIIAAALLLIVVVLIIVPLPARLFPTPSTLAGPFRGPSRRARVFGNKLGKLWEDVAARTKDVIPLPIRATTTGEAPESDTISFAVRSFLYMTTSAEKDGGESLLSAKEERTLGKKLASGIRAIAQEKPLYLQYPEDAALFLHIWSRYGSRDETNRYLTKSFKSKPENAVALLKCYLAGAAKPEAGTAGKNKFTRAQYEALAEVVDPDNVYAAIVKLYKFKLENIEDIAPGDPADRAIAYQFLRIHHQAKSETEKPGTATP